MKTYRSLPLPVLLWIGSGKMRKDAISNATLPLNMASIDLQIQPNIFNLMVLTQDLRFALRPIRSVRMLRAGKDLKNELIQSSSHIKDALLVAE